MVSNNRLTNLMMGTVLATMSGIMPVVYTRARFGEDLLEASGKEGLDQYVIVGAGRAKFQISWSTGASGSDLCDCQDGRPPAQGCHRPPAVHHGLPLQAPSQ